MRAGGMRLAWGWGFRTVHGADQLSREFQQPEGDCRIGAWRKEQTTRRNEAEWKQLSMFCQCRKVICFVLGNMLPYQKSGSV